MSVFERLAEKRRATTQTRATCSRCHREYTPDPEIDADDEHCWWCAARISQNQMPVVTE
jgi:hypothetical protein